MWNKKTGAKEKRLSNIDARKRHKKGVSIYHSDTHAMWKRFDNDVKRTTHMFEGMFIDPFDNDNPSGHPLNFASGVVTTTAIKESLLKALDKGSQISLNFTKKHLIPSENNILRPTSQV